MRSSAGQIRLKDPWAPPARGFLVGAAGEDQETPSTRPSGHDRLEPLLAGRLTAKPRRWRASAVRTRGRARRV